MTIDAAALVVGLGSIGRRHAAVLAELGVTTHTVSRRPGADFATLGEALAARPDVDLVVIATETSAHAEALAVLAARGFAGTALVEKPVVASPAELGANHRMSLANTFVGYNLRFHSAIDELKSFYENNDVLSIEIHAGQDLRTWREGRDVHASYSASREQGGGVLRDLSHELDYLLWIAGPWKRVLALGGTFSSLNIESDDLWHLLLEMEEGQLCSVAINYLDNPARRTVHLSGNQGSCTADLIAGTVTTGNEVIGFETPRDQTYRLMHEALLGNGADERLCTLKEGLDVVDLIAAVERSQQEESWIHR